VAGRRFGAAGCRGKTAFDLVGTHRRDIRFCANASSSLTARWARPSSTYKLGEAEFRGERFKDWTGKDLKGTTSC
jgi:hypothetical protein